MKKSPPYTYISTHNWLPQDGLSTLISEWLNYKKQTKSTSLLILQALSPPTKDQATNLVQIIQNLAYRFELSQTDISICNKLLSDTELSTLYQNSNAILSCKLNHEILNTATLTAIRAGIPIIYPRHSQLARFIPESYPFNMESDCKIISLPDPLKKYSLATYWNVVRQGEMCKKLTLFEASSTETIAHAIAQFNIEGLKETICEF